MADSRVRAVLYAEVTMANAVRTLLSEPRVPNPPKRVRLDWIVMAAIVVTATIEVIARSDLSWPLFQYAFTLALSLTLLWRRTYPLLMVGVAFGASLVHSIVFYAEGEASEGLYTTAFMLLLPYALLRWGPGRHIVPGVTLMLAVATFSLITGAEDGGEAIGGIIVLLFPAVLGAAARYQTTSRARKAEQIRLLEREQLARELHDTVAHHVSAIAIQAQAGRAVAATDPAAAIRTLETIEEAASQSLAEMRAMVGVLRNSGEVALAPQRGIADIDGLAGDDGPGPSVRVELSGKLDDLRPSVEAAVFRLAQESVTNARRHARHATSVEVRIIGDEETIHLTVRDDGDTVLFNNDTTDGFGLEGMAERAKLLGGTFTAGPDRHRGWTIAASLPKNGVRP